MTLFNQVARSLSQVSRALAPGHVTTGRCHRCGRKTRWLVNLMRGQFRCLECNTPNDEGSAPQ